MLNDLSSVSRDNLTGNCEDRRQQTAVKDEKERVNAVMKRKQHITAFYLETLLMIVVFISIILVLTRVFGNARVQSAEAKQLTSAVTLAQNTAEAVSASGSPEELFSILNAEQNALIRQEAENGSAFVTAVYDKKMDPVEIADEIRKNAEAGSPDSLLHSGDLIVETAWTPSKEQEGMVDAVVTVYNGSTGRAVYTLDTSVYVTVQLQQ